jgi:hypothetical protein
VIRSVKIYAPAVTIGDLADFLAEAERMGASREDRVTIRVAPTSPHPTDPGGEITVEVRVES